MRRSDLGAVPRRDIEVGLQSFVTTSEIASDFCE